jgi:amino acid adenylation domain-containing protein
MMISSNESMPSTSNRYQTARSGLPYEPIKRDDLDRSIVELFERQVRRNPDHIALKAVNRVMTYSELDRLANRVANAILSRDQSRGSPITINVGDDMLTMIAVMGVLKSGHCYVPLNHELPSLRLRSILEDSTASTVVTCNECLPLTRDLVGGQYRIVNLDSLETNSCDENPRIPIAAADIAHIIYTSGSTGLPKGVIETHRNIIHHVMRVTNSAYYSATDRMTLLRPPNSGGALMNTYSALLNGASLYSLDIKKEGIQRLVRLLVEEQITVYHSSATVFRHVLASLDRATQFPYLRLIRLGSEPVLKRDIELYRRLFPASTCTIVNALNCTEANTVRQYFIDGKSEIIGDIVPVGYAADDMEVVLLDDSGTEVGNGEIGEIAIKSRFLSPGYWRKPELTRAAFVTGDNTDVRLLLTGDVGRMRSDGCLEYVGRKDFQLKIRGHKVHTNEVESALLGVPGVEQAVAVGDEAVNGDPRLIAYLVLRDDRKLTSSQLQNALKICLPSYMLPAAYVVLESMPLTANGKIDRRSLPPAPQARPELGELYVAPRTPIESALAKIWSESLNIDHVGVNDPLFEIGADSLLASTIVSKVNRIFTLDLAPHALFQADTVARFSTVVISNGGNVQRIEAVARSWLKVESVSVRDIREAIAAEKKIDNAG